MFAMYINTQICLQRRSEPKANLLFTARSKLLICPDYQFCLAFSRSPTSSFKRAPRVTTTFPSRPKPNDIIVTLKQQEYITRSSPCGVKG